MNIEDFIKSEKPNPTKALMGAFKEEIRKLLSLEYSTAQILKFLEANHVKCNKQTLGKFILRHKLRQASPSNPLPFVDLPKEELAEVKTPLEIPTSQSLPRPISENNHSIKSAIKQSISLLGD